MKVIVKATLKGAFTGACLGMIPIVHVSHAQQVVDPAAAQANRSGLRQSLNGTPVQDIAAPNAGGLSHNKFSTFNVDTKGLVINNSRINAISGIGGAVVANPNLANGEARLILNEVTGANRSILQGTQELLGGRAAYILANPSGITCDGCGFINFPRATLTTGSPILSNGAITGFTVNGGDLFVGPGGLNATGVDFFDILTRAAVINGRVNANDLTLVLGRNQVDYATNQAAALAADGTAPAFSLDSSALGGMYAGRIWLRSTEAGVGVRALGTMAASVSDVVLDTNGKITFSNSAVSAQRDLVLKTAGNPIELENATVYAGNDTTLQGSDIVLAGGRTGAGRDLSLAAATVTDTQSGQRDAGRDLSLQATGAVGVQGSTWQAGRNLAATADALSLQAGARMMGEADRADADGSGLGQTSISVANALSLQDAALFSGNTLGITAGSVSVDAASNDGGAQGIRGAGAVSVNAGTVDNAGLLASDAALAVDTASLTNRAGALMQGTSVALDATTITNAGRVGSPGALSIRADHVDNQAGGELLANGTLSLQGNGGVATQLTNAASGAILGHSLTAAFDTITNSGELYGNTTLTLTASTLDNNAGGSISTPGALVLQQAASGGTLDNDGTVEGGTLTAAYGTIRNNAGKIFGDQSAMLTVSNLANAAQLSSDGALTLNTAAARGSSLVNTGSIDGGQLGAHFDTITNDGALYGGSSLDASANLLTNRKSVTSGGTMNLAVANLANTSTATDSAEIYAMSDLGITGNHTLANTSATGKVASIVSRNGSLSIDSRSGDAASQSVTNSGGLLFAGANLNLLVTRLFLNQAAAGMRGYTFANTGSMLLGAPESATLLAAAQSVTVRNVDSDIEASAGNLRLNATYFQNTTTDAAPLKQEVYLGRRTSGYFDYDGTLDNTGSMVEVYSNCGQYSDHFDDTRVGHRCTGGVDMYEEQLVGSPSTAPRARFIAGGSIDMFIESQALNYVSLISAGGNITVTGGPGATFENRAETLRYRENAYVVRYDDGGVDHTPAGCDDECFFGWDNGVGPDDALTHHKQFTNISLGTDPFHYNKAGIKSTVQAVGGITINLHEVINSSTGEKLATSAIPGTTAPPTPATDPNAPGGVPTQGLGTSTLAGISSLASSPFFVPAQNPSSPFLYETNPRLMSLAGLYGSDLLLKSLGLDPTAYLRLGDPYFEQQLLRQQLLATAGQLFIADGLAGENDQFKMLAENAAGVREDLQLRVGVALTAEQIANLHKDIIWLVETEVAGKKVLVPQLYLSDATKAKLADGARFLASNINIKTEGPVSNSGAFVASNNIAIDAGTTFTNRMGTLVAANGLTIMATEDIRNQSGTIRGGDVTLESRTGSVINETLTRDETVHGAHGSGTSTVVGQTATIESTGNLNIKAAQDIVSRGGQVTAGGDASLDAGRDITFTAIEKKSLTSSVTNTESDGYRTTTTASEQKTEQVGSGLSVGGNLAATAKRDINIEASSVDVAGDGRLDAGRDINITALGETSKSQEDTKTSSWNSRSSEETTIERTTGKASTVNLGGTLTISSGGNTNIKGSELAVGGDLDIEKIGGNLNVTTFEEKTTVTSEKKTSSFFGGEAKAEAGDNITQSKASAKGTLFANSEEKTDIDSTTHLRSGISVGGNLNAGKGAIKGDVNITGSQIAAGGDMNLAADGNINVLAAEDKTTVTTSSKSTAAYVGAEASIDGAGAKFGVDHTETNGSATQTTAKVSGLSAGGNIDINAGGDFTEQGTQVAAGGDIKVEADKITSLAAKDSYTETGDSLSVSVSIGVTAETGLGAVVGSFIDDKGKADFDMAAASESINGLSVPDAGSVKAELKVSTTKTTSTASGNEAKTSSFSAGGNVSFTAREGDATFKGTQVEAGKAIEVTASKGSVNILAADSNDQASKTTTKAEVTVGVSMDGTISGSGSGSKESESSSSTRQTAASFKAGTDLSVTAQNDVTLVGTNLEAGGTASIEAKEGKIDFQAARDTTSASSDSESANASFSANISGKEGSVGGGGGTMATRESSSTGKAGSITAGNVVLKSKGDITLEGTNIAAKDSASIETQGKVDFKAVEDKYSRTAQGKSAQVDLEAGATGGGAKVGASTTDEFEESSTKRGGTLTASNLTIKAGDGIRLEGTGVEVKQDASIDAGKGKLVLESAVSTRTVRTNNDAAEVGVKGDVKTGAGQGSVKVESASENTNQVTNQNASIQVGGKADVKAAGGIDVKGSNVTGVDSVIQAGSLDTHGAAVSVEQRQDVNESTKSNTSVSVGVIVPSKKARKEVTDLANKANDSKAATTLRNKAENAKAALGLQTKDQATENKRQNNVAYADRKATQAEARITADQGKKDQKASYDQQKADDRATAERDKALKAVDTTATVQAQEAAKAKIQSEFDAKKQANAETAGETKQQNAIAALEAKNKYADKTLTRKDAAENKAADSKVRHADETGKVQLALAAKTSDDATREQKVEQAKTTQIEQKGKVEAERAARQVDLKADTDKAKAENDAKKARVEADLAAQAQAKTAADKAREKQRQDDADVDKDQTLSAQEKADRKAANAKTADAEIAQARKDLDASKEGNAQAESEKLAAIVTDREKARADAELARQTKLAEADREKAALAVTEAVTKAAAKAEKEMQAKVAALDTKLANETKALDRKRDTDLAAARTKRDQDLKAIDADKSKTAAQKKTEREAAQKRFTDAETLVAKTYGTEKAAAEKKHEGDVNKARVERGSDRDVADAREKARQDLDALDKQRDQKVAQLAEDAVLQKKLADLDGEHRKALADKAAEKAEADAAVDGDDSLSATEKARRLDANARKLAAETMRATAEHARKEETQKRERDEKARKAEEDAIDPKLSDAEKTAKKKEIADKYEARKKDREDARAQELARGRQERERALEDARVERQHRMEVANAAGIQKRKQDALDAKLGDDLKAAEQTRTDAIAALDPKLSPADKKREQDRIEYSAAVKKSDLQARRDTEAAKAAAEADIRRIEADRKRTQDAADLAKQREDAALAKETGLEPAERTRRQDEITKRHADTKARADDRLAAQKKDAEARRDEEVAAAEHKRRDADIDADTALTDKDKAAKKKESERTFLADQKTAQAKRDEAAKELAALMSPEEKAAAESLAAKAKAGGARVKNPYALSTRAKYYSVKVRRWKEVITSFGIDVSTAPPPAEEEEVQADTLKDLLPLARQFQAGDQAMALRLLRDPAVQAAAAVATAVGELRAEAREEMIKAYTVAQTGKQLGVLTVADRREVLAREGIELPAGLPAAEVTRRFNAYLDAAVASLQPTTAQKAEILEELKVTVDTKKTVDEVYAELLAKGRKQAEQAMAGMGLPPSRAQAFGDLLVP